MLREIVSACGTQNVKTIEQNSSWKCTAGNCAGAGFSGSRRRGSKIENKNIRSRYVDELARVTKSEKGMKAHTGFMRRNCFGSNKNIRCCMVCVFREPQSQVSPVSQQFFCIRCLNNNKTDTSGHDFIFRRFWINYPVLYWWKCEENLVNPLDSLRIIHLPWSSITTHKRAVIYKTIPVRSPKSYHSDEQTKYTTELSRCAGPSSRAV
jgi:hypothetical protein